MPKKFSGAEIWAKYVIRVTNSPTVYWPRDILYADKITIMAVPRLKIVLWVTFKPFSDH